MDKSEVKSTTYIVSVLLHYLDIVFSILTTVALYSAHLQTLASLSVILLVIERVVQFISHGRSASKWLSALSSFVFIDYFLEMRGGDSNSDAQIQGRRYFQKRFIRTLIVSAPLSLFAFFAHFNQKSTPTIRLLLACGIIHIISSTHCNFLYYTQSVDSISRRQRTYIALLILFESFYRLTFLSLLFTSLGEGGIAGVLVAEFIIHFVIEFAMQRKEEAGYSKLVKHPFLKAWTSVFYFRFEDVMVQDTDEWNEDNRSVGNPRQAAKLINFFKSKRSKWFITIRFLENLALTIAAILIIAKNSANLPLFIIAIILAPLFVIWNVKYLKFNFEDERSSVNVNGKKDIKQITKKYRDDAVKEKDSNRNKHAADAAVVAQNNLPSQEYAATALQQNTDEEKNLSDDSTTKKSRVQINGNKFSTNTRQQKSDHRTSSIVSQSTLSKQQKISENITSIQQTATTISAASNSKQFSNNTVQALLLHSTLEDQQRHSKNLSIPTNIIGHATATHANEDYQDESPIKEFAQVKSTEIQFTENILRSDQEISQLADINAFAIE